MLVGAALAAVGVSVALGLELALLEPWLSNVLARRMAGEALPAVATELFRDSLPLFTACHRGAACLHAGRACLPAGTAVAVGAVRYGG